MGPGNTASYTANAGTRFVSGTHESVWIPAEWLHRLGEQRPTDCSEGRAGSVGHSGTSAARKQ